MITERSQIYFNMALVLESQKRHALAKLYLQRAIAEERKLK